MIKKQTFAALLLLLLIPAVTIGGGVLFSLIIPGPADRRYSPFGLT